MGRERWVCSEFWSETQTQQNYSRGAVVSWATYPDGHRGPWASWTPQNAWGVNARSVLREKVQNSASICFTIIILHCQIEQCHSNGSYAAKVLTATIIWETRVTFATRLHNFHCCGIVPFGSVKLKRLSVIDSCDRQTTGHISWLHSWHYVNFVLMLWFW